MFSTNNHYIVCDSSISRAKMLGYQGPSIRESRACSYVQSVFDGVLKCYVKQYPYCSHENVDRIEKMRRTNVAIKFLEKLTNSKLSRKALIAILNNPNFYERDVESFRHLFVSYLGLHKLSHEDLNLQDTEGKTFLYHAAKIGDEVMVKILLDLGANPNLKNKDGYTPLLRVITKRNFLNQTHLKVCALLIRNGTQIEHSIQVYGAWHGYQKRTTPLHEAAGRGLVDVVKLLIASNVDKGALDSFSKTVFECTGNEEIKALLKSC